jgi:hypothetical protein
MSTTPVRATNVNRSLRDRTARDRGLFQRHVRRGESSHRPLRGLDSFGIVRRLPPPHMVFAPLTIFSEKIKNVNSGNLYAINPLLLRNFMVVTVRKPGQDCSLRSHPYALLRGFGLDPAFGQ